MQVQAGAHLSTFIYRQLGMFIGDVGNLQSKITLSIPRMIINSLELAVISRLGNLPS